MAAPLLTIFLRGKGLAVAIAGSGRKAVSAIVGLFDVRDVVGLVGVGLIAGGVWQISPPAALIVTGVLFVAASAYGVISSGRGEPAK